MTVIARASTVATIATLSLFVLAASSAVSSADAGQSCYKGGQAYGKVGSGIKKSNAQKRAREHWTDYARKLMGTSRVGWDWAKYKGYHCEKKGIWYCRAIATPCL